MRANAVVRIFLAVLGFWLSISVPAHGLEQGGDACPYGTAGFDGCGQALLQGIYKNSAFFSVGVVTNDCPVSTTNCRNSAPQSGQAPSGYATRPTWNVAGVDYPIGPNSVQLPSISTWAAGTNGCTYYPAGAKLINSKIATNGGWPHTFDGTYYYAISNVLVCTGNGGNNYSINGYTFQDATNGQCANLFIYDTHDTATVKIYNNAWINTVNSAGSAAACSQCALSATNGCQAGGAPSGFITLAYGIETPIDIESNYFNGKWDQPWAAPPSPPTGTNVVGANQLRADFTFKYNWVYHSQVNPLNFTGVPLTGKEHACSTQQNPSWNAGQTLTGWPYDGYNIVIEYNYFEGIGHATGFGHGEIMNWNYAPAATSVADSEGSLSGTMLTTSSNAIQPGSLIFDSGGVITGGVETTSAAAGSGPYTYTVTNPGGFSFSNSNINAYWGNVCELLVNYNTMLWPAASVAGMTTSIYGFNTSASYLRKQGIIEYFSVQNNTIVTNRVGGATTYGGAFRWRTTGGAPNYLQISGLNPNCTNGPPPGSLMNTGSYNIGPNQLVSCSGGVATWSAGCASVRGATCPAIQYHLASGASSINGTSNFTYQVASVSVAEASHATNLNVVTWANNYIDPTGGGGGTLTTYKRVWDIHPSGNMYCQSPVRLAGNVNLLDGSSLNAGSWANIAGTGC
jgi:hypothetical protein